MRLQGRKETIITSHMIRGTRINATFWWEGNKTFDLLDSVIAGIEGIMDFNET